MISAHASTLTMPPYCEGMGLVNHSCPLALRKCHPRFTWHGTLELRQAFARWKKPHFDGSVDLFSLFRRPYSQVRDLGQDGQKNEDDNEHHVSGQANKPLYLPPHALSYDAVSNELGANVKDGLTDAEGKSRLEEFGPNELDDGPGVQPVKILVRQVANAMMLVSQFHSTRTTFP